MVKLQPPDQLTTALLWIAAIFMAVKEGIERWPAASRAFPLVADWGWLNFVPLALLSLAAWRQLFASARMGPGELKSANELTRILVDASDRLRANEPLIERPGALGDSRAAMMARVHQRYMVPDTRLPNAFGHLASSNWARDHAADEATLEREFRDKLHSGQLLAFGRIGADGNLDPIFLDVWQAVHLNPHTGNVETDDGKPMYFGVQFSSNRLAHLWPAWRDTYGL